jgi:hypothetical protein
MQAVFKIENLIPSSVFGRGLPFPGLPKGDGKTFPAASGLNHFSPLGTRYYMPVGFLINGSVLQLPWEPSMSISVQKTIVETAMAGNTRRGTIKELINTQDYVINLQGLCLDETRNGYPFLQVESIKKIFEYEGSIEIISALTDMLGIKNVVIKSWSIPEQIGRPYSQPFTIDMISDEDFLLIQD